MTNYFSSLLSDSFSSRHLQPTYPPHNIIQLTDNELVLELAIAGFKPEDLTVTVEDTKLVIAGDSSKTKVATDRYIHRGIGMRNFIRTFSLSQNTKLDRAEYSDGILSVFLIHEIPEEKKPKEIPINRGERLYLTE